MPPIAQISSRRGRRRFRLVKRVFIGLVAIDLIAGIGMFAAGGPSLLATISRQHQGSDHPKMKAERLADILNSAAENEQAIETVPPSYICNTIPNNGWDYSCRNRWGDIGYYDVSETKIVKQSVIPGRR